MDVSCFDKSLRSDIAEKYSVLI